jgi:hypothetical protein
MPTFTRTNIFISQISSKFSTAKQNNMIREVSKIEYENELASYIHTNKGNIQDGRKGGV